MKNKLVVIALLSALICPALLAQEGSKKPSWAEKVGILQNDKTSYVKVLKIYSFSESDARERMVKLITEERRSSIGRRVQASDEGEVAGFTYAFQELGFYAGTMSGNGRYYYFLVQVCKSYECRDWEKVKPKNLK
ncbi:MAG: hypothetical protein MJZ20_11005 [Bacteroidaceae bacterium]|nr:hypothetical protein [Bacteroidaceae bacterium]